MFVFHLISAATEAPVPYGLGVVVVRGELGRRR